MLKKQMQERIDELEGNLNGALRQRDDARKESSIFKSKWDDAITRCREVEVLLARSGGYIDRVIQTDRSNAKEPLPDGYVSQFEQPVKFHF